MSSGGAGGATVGAPAWSCAGDDDPDLWFSASPSDVDLAIAICQRCPALTACARLRSDLVGNGFPAVGVWAGVAHAGAGWHRPKKSGRKSDGAQLVRRIELYQQGWTDRPTGAGTAAWLRTARPAYWELESDERE